MPFKGNFDYNGLRKLKLSLYAPLGKSMTMVLLKLTYFKHFLTSYPLRLEFGSFDPWAISVQLYHLHLSCPYKKLTDKKCLIADSIAEQKVNVIKSDADYLLF